MNQTVNQAQPLLPDSRSSNFSHFLGLLGRQGMSFQEMHHQQARLALVQLLDEVLNSLLPDVLRSHGRRVNIRLLAAVGPHHALRFETVQQGRHRRVRPGAASRAKRIEHLSHSPALKAPQDLQDVQLGIWNRRRSLGHDETSRSYSIITSRKTLYHTSYRKSPDPQASTLIPTSV